MEEANHIEANDSDYDPNKDAKKEVRPKDSGLEVDAHDFDLISVFMN